VFVAGFLGANNMLPGRVGRTGPDGTMVDVLGMRISAPTLAGATDGADVTVMVRPERLSVLPAGATPGAGNHLAGAVRATVFQGSRELVIVDCAEGASLQAECPPAARWQAGDRVVVSWPADATHLLPAAARA
jgi:ABC-type Fe3+/spermidine/putrescine transport system ATPase subunit